jgi:diacylglycerol kinase (ATP)
VELPSHLHSDISDLLLVNPAAGGGRANAALPALREFARRQSWNVEICVTQSPQDLVDSARRAAKAGRKRIFVLGGDGTFQLVVNAVSGFPDIILGVIPDGGGNDLAAALGLPQDPVQAAAHLLKSEVSVLDAANVGFPDGSERRFVGGGGVGLDAEASRYANGLFRNLRGRMRYVLAAIRALFGFRTFRVRVTTCSSEPQDTYADVLLLGVLNTPSYGAGLYLAPNAQTDDGELDLVFVEHLSLREILTLLPGLAARGQLQTNRVHRFRATKVRIETESPRWFQADGELLGMTPVEVSIVPGAIQILRPRQPETSGFR